MPLSKRNQLYPLSLPRETLPELKRRAESKHFDNLADYVRSLIAQDNPDLEIAPTKKREKTAAANERETN